MSVLVLQHHPQVHAGVMGEVLVDRGVDLHTVRAWREPVPRDAGRHDGIIVLGGDMDTDQDDIHPFLAAERDLLATAVPTGVPVLGLCLGAQLLAEATGGSVTHGTPEIGYVPIHHVGTGAQDPVVGAVADGTPFFNAHRDVIATGAAAEVLARSAQTGVHAFRVGDRAYGLQFHPEIDATFVAGYVETDGIPAYLRANGWEPDELLHQARAHNRAHRRAGWQVLAAWVDGVLRH